MSRAQPPPLPLVGDPLKREAEPPPLPRDRARGNGAPRGTAAEPPPLPRDRARGNGAPRGTAAEPPPLPRDHARGIGAPTAPLVREGVPSPGMIATVAASGEGALGPAVEGDALVNESVGELKLGGAKRLAENVIEELWFGDDDPVRTHLHASGSLAATTAVAAGLKPFPVIAQRVLRLSQTPSTSAAELSRAIESDPGLTAKVLHVANSALYAPSHSCKTIENATMRLGMRNIGRIVATLVAHGMFDDVNPMGAKIRDHCVGVSILARLLATDARVADADDLFLIGLLHDVGKLLAMQTKDIDYATIEGDGKGFPHDTHLKERELVGWDHAVLGAHVIEHWQLPREISQVVAWHHQPGRAFVQGGAIAESVGILRLADRLEYQISIQRALDDEFIDCLERESVFEYTQHNAAMLRAAWPGLVAAIDDGRKIFSVKKK